MKLTYEQLQTMYEKALGLSYVTPGLKYLHIAARIAVWQRQKVRREYIEFIKNNL